MLFTKEISFYSKYISYGLTPESAVMAMVTVMARVVTCGTGRAVTSNQVWT